MNLEVLRVFVDVVRRGSFAAVAQDRAVSPSAISRAVSGLEHEIGLRLFQRTTRRLSPTEAGQVYFQRIEPLLEEIERARLAAADVSDRPSGRLRATASVAFGQKCLVPLLPRFHARFPELAVELMLTDGRLDLIEERIDVAIRLGPRQDSGFIGSKLFDTRYRVCASPDYLRSHGPIETPGDLARHPALVFALAGYRSRWIFESAQGEREAVPVNPRFVISNALALRDGAVAGLGVALLADWVVDDALANGFLVDLFPDHRATATDFETAAWLLYPSRAYLPLKVRVFIDFLRSELGRRFPTG